MRRYEKDMILASIFKFFIRIFCHFRFLYYLCTRLEAQMAESVDALVSNTSGATRAGSTPALFAALFYFILINLPLFPIKPYRIIYLMLL